VPICRREHFNRWYSTSAYYLALTIVDVPALIFNNIVFVLITYFMTNMPLEAFRMALFLLISVLVGFTAQGFGIFLGSAFSLHQSLLIASGGIAGMTLFSGFFVLLKDTHYYWHWLFYGSFLKHALDADFLVIFGFNRKKLDCNADYCHYRWPHKFLESLGVQTTFHNALAFITFSLFLYRFLAFFVIKYRLKH
jgi:ABC-type multidrug transport system permease subunit